MDIWIWIIVEAIMGILSTMAGVHFVRELKRKNSDDIALFEDVPAIASFIMAIICFLFSILGICKFLGYFGIIIKIIEMIMLMISSCTISFFFLLSLLNISIKDKVSAYIIILAVIINLCFFYNFYFYYRFI